MGELGQGAKGGNAACIVSRFVGLSSNLSYDGFVATVRLSNLRYLLADLWRCTKYCNNVSGMGKAADFYSTVEAS